MILLNGSTIITKGNRSLASRVVVVAVVHQAAIKKTHTKICTAARRLNRHGLIDDCVDRPKQDGNGMENKRKDKNTHIHTHIHVKPHQFCSTFSLFHQIDFFYSIFNIIHLFFYYWAENLYPVFFE